MAKMMKTALGIFAVVALAGGSAVVGGGVLFDRRVSREVADLFAGDATATPLVVTEAQLAGLPEPVQRWLRRAQVVGQERPATIRLKMAGQFRTGEGQAWLPFTAEEYYTTDPPGFVWVARMRMMGILPLTGRDKFVGGRGALNFNLLSLIPVASATGPELDRGALLRYLNETMWFPAAALSPYIVWEPIDAHSAKATMTYRGMSAPATFIFDDAGDLTNMVAERYRAVGSGFALDTWSTPLSAYGDFNGLRVPVAGEGIWKLSSGDFSYIKLRVTALEYNHPKKY